jgi:hypothetical protein
MGIGAGAGGELYLRGGRRCGRETVDASVNRCAYTALTQVTVPCRGREERGRAARPPTANARASMRETRPNGVQPRGRQHRSWAIRALRWRERWAQAASGRKQRRAFVRRGWREGNGRT